MKKLVTLLAAIITLTSCSSDDDNNADKGNNKSLSSITLSNGDGTGQPEVLTVIYDDNGNIKAFAADDDILYAYKYDTNNNLISISRGLSSDAEYTFQYTNGRLSGYTDESGTTTAIGYNEQTKMYTIGDSARQFSLKGRDIGTVSEAGENMYTFNYDDSHKGALYNIKGDNLFVLTMFSELYQYMSVRPMTSIATGDDSYTLDNTFDADGYVTKEAINYNGQVQSVLTYQYTEK